MKETKYTLTVGGFTLEYGYSVACRKWTFKAPEVCHLIACKGNEQAHKVAKLIAGAINRCGKMDGCARSNIARVLATKS